MNTWRGANIPKKNPQTTGLVAFQVKKKLSLIQSDIAGLTIQFID
jgi:hypothetical protein